jgi:hypothetical protein
MSYIPLSTEYSYNKLKWGRDRVAFARTEYDA